MRANVFIDLAQNRIKVTPSITDIENNHGDMFINNLCVRNCYIGEEKDYVDDKLYREFNIACDNEWHKFINRLNKPIDIVAFLKTFDTLNIVIINHRGCVICGES